MPVRCVITGQGNDGKSVFVRDSAVEPITLALLPGYEFFRLWGRDGVPALPEDGRSPVPRPYFPTQGGFRFGLFCVPPLTRPPEPGEVLSALGELQQKLPGMAEVLELANPGMHTTDTVDFDVVLSGEVFLELDDGAEVHLGPGDCVVQNGTRHRWVNRSPHPCLLAVCLIGATRSPGRVKSAVREPA